MVCVYLLTVIESNKRCRLLRDQVIQESQHQPLRLLNILMNVAKLEHKLREVCPLLPLLSVSLAAAFQCLGAFLLHEFHIIESVGTFNPFLTLVGLGSTCIAIYLINLQ